MTSSVLTLDNWKAQIDKDKAFEIKLSNAFVTYLDTLHGNSEHMVTPFDEELDISLIRQFIVEKCKYTSPLLQQPLDDSIKEEMLRAIIPLVNPFARLMKFCKEEKNRLFYTVGSIADMHRDDDFTSQFINILAKGGFLVRFMYSGTQDAMARVVFSVYHPNSQSIGHDVTTILRSFFSRTVKNSEKVFLPVVRLRDEAQLSVAISHVGFLRIPSSSAGFFDGVVRDRGPFYARVATSFMNIPPFVRMIRSSIHQTSGVVNEVLAEGFKISAMPEHGEIAWDQKQLVEAVSCVFQCHESNVGVFRNEIDAFCHSVKATYHFGRSSDDETRSVALFVTIRKPDDEVWNFHVFKQQMAALSIRVKKSGFMSIVPLDLNARNILLKALLSLKHGSPCNSRDTWFSEFVPQLKVVPQVPPKSYASVTPGFVSLACSEIFQMLDGVPLPNSPSLEMEHDPPLPQSPSISIDTQVQHLEGFALEDGVYVPQSPSSSTRELGCSPRPGNMNGQEEADFIYKSSLETVWLAVEHSKKPPEDLYDALCMYVPYWLHPGNLPSTRPLPNDTELLSAALFANAKTDIFTAMIYALRAAACDLQDASGHFKDSLDSFNAQALSSLYDGLLRTQKCIEGIMPVVSGFIAFETAIPSPLKEKMMKIAEEERAGGRSLSPAKRLRRQKKRRVDPALSGQGTSSDDGSTKSSGDELLSSHSSVKSSMMDLPEILENLHDDNTLKNVYICMQNIHYRLKLMEPRHPLLIDWDQSYTTLQRMHQDTQDALQFFDVFQPLIAFLSRAADNQ